MATTNKAIKWNKRLKEGRWFKRGFWHTAYYLGRIFSLARWNPFKNTSRSKQENIFPNSSSTLQAFFSDKQTVSPLFANDTLTLVASFVDIRTLGKLSRLSKASHEFFAPFLEERHSPVKLLQYVMNGDQIAAEKLLIEYQKKQPNACLVTKRETGKEQNGREWNKPINALEFAAWTGDVTDPSNDQRRPGMLNMLLKYIPISHKQEALEQIQNIKDHGTQHGRFMTPFDNLSWAYRDYYNDDYKKESLLKDMDSTKYYIKHIGYLQNRLTNFGLQWLCDDEAFSIVTVFNRSPNRTLILEGKLLERSELGKTFFIYKWGRPREESGAGDSRFYTWKSWYVGCWDMYFALQNLYRASRDNLEHCISALQNDLNLSTKNRP